MQLVLLRHAEAEERAEGESDLQRRLTKKGRAQAKAMAKHLAARLPFEPEIWVSQAARSAETVAPLTAKPIVKPGLNPDADALSALGMIRAEARKKNLLICGHQPWIGQLAEILMESRALGFSVAFKKGAAMWLEVDWVDERRECRLKSFLSPSDLGAATRR